MVNTNGPVQRLTPAQQRVAEEWVKKYGHTARGFGYAFARKIKRLDMVEDFMQLCLLGVIYASATYDPTRGTAPKTWVGWKVRSECEHAARSSLCWSPTPPRSGGVDDRWRIGVSVPLDGEGHIQAAVEMHDALGGEDTVPVVAVCEDDLGAVDYLASAEALNMPSLQRMLLRALASGNTARQWGERMKLPERGERGWKNVMQNLQRRLRSHGLGTVPRSMNGHAAETNGVQSAGVGDAVDRASHRSTRMGAGRVRRGEVARVGGGGPEVRASATAQAEV